MNGRATLPQLASHLPWPQALLDFAVLKNPLLQVWGLAARLNRVPENCHSLLESAQTLQIWHLKNTQT